MRKIITNIFVTLDGVMQAPGGPEEDVSDGFKYGGWQFTIPDEEVGKAIGEFMALPFELLLGRKTYDIWAAYWPKATEMPDISKPFNSTRKYVVSHKQRELGWNNSKLVSGDVVLELKKLKNLDAPDLWVCGSSELIQTLLENKLIDRMQVFIYPMTIGSGKKLFAGGTLPQNFKLVASKISPLGVIMASYEPGEPLKIG